MADATYRHFTCRMMDEVLVLTITESQMQGDTLADELHNDFQQLINDTGARKVVLDLIEVTYFSSACFRPLLSLRRRLQTMDGRMILCNLAPLVLEVFQVLRLVSTSGSAPATFEIAPDVAAAVARAKS